MLVALCLVASLPLCLSASLLAPRAADRYTDSWFGPMNNSISNGSEGVLASGRFAYLPEYLMGSQPVGIHSEWQERYLPLQNGYGYVYGDKTNNKGFMARSDRMCGIDPRGEFATCGLFVDCFTNHDTFDGWEKCMERDVHAHMHVWHGGVWGCSEDVQEWIAARPGVPESVARFIVQNLVDTWLDYGTVAECVASRAATLVSRRVSSRHPTSRGARLRSSLPPRLHRPSPLPVPSSVAMSQASRAWPSGHPACRSRSPLRPGGICLPAILGGGRRPSLNHRVHATDHPARLLRLVGSCLAALVALAPSLPPARPRRYYLCPPSSVCGLKDSYEACTCQTTLNISSLQASDRGTVDALLNNTLHQWHKHAYEGQRYISPQVPTVTASHAPALHAVARRARAITPMTESGKKRTEQRGSVSRSARRRWGGREDVHPNQQRVTSATLTAR